MNRRNFILATGSTTIGAGTLYKLTQQPSLAVNGDIGLEDTQYTVREDDAGNLGTLQITLNDIDITTTNIDENDIEIKITYEQDDSGEETLLDTTGIPEENSSYNLVEDISDLAPESDGEQNSYDFDVTIEVSHEDVPTQELKDEFTFNVLKEIIDEINFVTTDELIEVENEDKVNEEDGVTTGIIKTGVIEEMTTLED